MLLIDTNVLLDLVTDDARWADWRQRQLEAASLHVRLIINPAIYAELSIGFDRIEDVDEVLDTTGIEPASIRLAQSLPPPPKFPADLGLDQPMPRGASLLSAGNGPGTLSGRRPPDRILRSHLAARARLTP